MAAPHSFHRFPDLPPELRMQVWEEHFRSLRKIHVLGDVWALSLHATISRPYTACENVPLIRGATFAKSMRPEINREAYAVAMKMLDSQWTRREVLEQQGFGDVALSKPSGSQDGWRVTDTIDPSQPRWDIDLVYLSTSCRRDPLATLASHEWAKKIQYLAVRSTRKTLNDLLYAAASYIEPQSKLGAFPSLKELHLVADAETYDAVWMCDWQRKPRNRFGFVEFTVEEKSWVPGGWLWAPTGRQYGPPDFVRAVDYCQKWAKHHSGGPVVFKTVVNVDRIAQPQSEGLIYAFKNWSP